MAIVRTPKDKNNHFVQADKELINNKNLSAKAKGIMLYILSKPDNWSVYESEIAKNMNDGVKSIRSGIKELMEHGYIERKQRRCSGGKFIGYDYTVYENRCLSTESTERPFSENGFGPPSNNNLTKRATRREKIDEYNDMTLEEKYGII